MGCNNSQDYSEQEQEEAVQAANEAANGRRQTQCLVQLHMWMLLMAHTERMLKTSLDSDMHALVSSWQAGLDSSELSHYMQCEGTSLLKV